MIQKFEL